MRRDYLLLAVLILLVAAGLRLSQLATYPPGPHFDEAANLLITRSIAFGGADLFPITNNYQGRETLYHYLNAPLLRLIADDIFVMQLSSVWINLLTIAASMTLGRLMFGKRRGLLVGLAIGVLMTVSFHQILLSRQAYRAILLPLMQALALLFLWRGLRSTRHGWLWLVIGGAFAGGALYTYMASRLFPLWLAIGGMVLIAFDSTHRWQRLKQGLIFFGAMLVISTPLITFALQNQDIFFGRLTEVTSESDVVVSLEESIRRHAEMFFIRGEDGNLRYNVPGRPYFNPLEALLLVIGIGVIVWRLYHTQNALLRAAYTLALLSPLMVIPGVISVGGFPPNHMRSLGMVPLIFIIPALGFESVYTAISNRIYQFNQRRVLAVTVCTVLVTSTVIIGNTYFNWAQRTDLYYQADGDLAAAADWLHTVADSETQVYVASFNPEHPTLITGWDGNITWLGLDSLFLPAPDQSAVYIITNTAQFPPEWQRLLADDRIETVPPDPEGNPAFQAYARTGTQSPDITTEVQNPYLALVDASIAPTAAGSTATVMMTWHIRQTPPFYRLRPILSLVDAYGNTLARNDVFLLGTNNWRSGETMLRQVPLQIPPTTPPGQYMVEISWADRDSESIVAYVNESGEYGGTIAALTQVDVTPATAPINADTLNITTRIDQPINAGVSIIGIDPANTSARQGELLHPTLYWQATPTDSERISSEITILLRDASGVDTTIWQGAPLNDQYPVTQWQDNHTFADRTPWEIPINQPAGTHTVVLQSGVDEIPLQTVEINAINRLLDAPDVETRVDASLGDVFSLYGYSLDISNQTINFEPVWLAQERVSEQYTVFVHVVDSNGVTIMQRDVMPQNYGYPTNLWIAGEYIVDQHTFTDVPAGNYTLRVGMYLQASGDILPVVQANQNATLESMNFISIYDLDISNN